MRGIPHSLPDPNHPEITRITKTLWDRGPRKCTSHRQVWVCPHASSSKSPRISTSNPARCSATLVENSASIRIAECANRSTESDGSHKHTQTSIATRRSVQMLRLHEDVVNNGRQHDAALESHFSLQSAQCPPLPGMSRRADGRDHRVYECQPPYPPYNL